MMEREKELVVASFASEFNIPVNAGGSIHYEPRWRRRSRRRWRSAW
jgi:hypothetical protein